MEAQKFTITTTPNDLIGEELILKYWEFDGRKFCHSVNVLAKESNLVLHQLTKIVSQNSQAKVIYGDCFCGDSVFKILKTRSDLQQALQQDKFKRVTICDKCKSRQMEELRLRQQEAKKNELRNKQYELDTALHEKRWERLNERELEVLYIIGRNNSKQAIYNSLFPSGVSMNRTNPIWQIINKLERLALIWVERQSTNGPIIDFHTSPDLNNAIFSHFNPVMDSEINTTTSIGDELKMSLKKNLGKTKINQPEFSGNFTFARNIMLKKGETYRYGGWLNDDGSVFIKIMHSGNSAIDTFESLPIPPSPIDKSSFTNFDASIDF